MLSRSIAILFCCLAPLAHAAEPSDLPPISIAEIARKTPIDFEHEVLPIFRDNCLACHNRTRAKADLILETPADILKGGENGPAVIPGKARQSLLLNVAAHRENPAMPPHENKVSATDLTPMQLGLIRLWIDQGAKGQVKGTANITWQAPAASLEPVYAVAVTTDGRFAAAGRANYIDLYDLATRQFVTSLADPQLPGGVAHREMVESLAFSPDGSLLASGGFAEVDLWQRSLPSTIFSLPVSSDEPRRVAVSSDGKWIAIAVTGQPIQLVDAATGKVARSIDTSTSPTRALCFSADGSKLAIASVDRGVRICDLGGRLMTQFVVASDVNALVWIGNRIAIACNDGIIRYCALDGSIHELLGHFGPVTALSAIGSQLFSGGADGTIRVWSIDNGQMIRTFNAGGAVSLIKVRPDAQAFIAQTANGPARLWDVAKGAVVAELNGDVSAYRGLAECDREHQLAGTAVAFHKATVAQSQSGRKAAGERLHSARAAATQATHAAAEKELARDKAVAAKQSAEATLANSRQALAESVASIDAGNRAWIEAVRHGNESSARARIISAWHAQLEKLNVITAQREAIIQADAAIKATEAAVAPATLARSNADTELRLSITADARAVTDLAAAQDDAGRADESLRRAVAALASAKSVAVAAERPLTSVSFSSDGRSIATTTGDSTICFWTADSGVPLDVIHRPHPVSNAAFCGNAVLVNSVDAIECMNKGGQWRFARKITNPPDSPLLVDRVSALAFSPDGKRLATGSGEPTRNGRIAIWDVATSELIRDLPNPHTDSVFTLQFSPDGKQLASGSADRLVKIFNAVDGSHVRTIEGHNGHVLGVAWRADGRVLASCAADGHVRFWNVATGDRTGAVAGTTKEVDAVSFLGLSDQVLAASGDGQLRSLNESGPSAQPLPRVDDFLHAAAVTPDGKLVVVGGEKGTLTVLRDLTAPAMTFPPPHRMARAAKQ